MKTSNILSILTPAVATAALTVVTFSGSMEAGNESASAGTKIARPKLSLSGVDLTLAPADGKVFHAGDKPTFELKGVNTTAQPQTVNVELIITSTTVDSPMRRTPAMPSILWQGNESITLNGSDTNAVQVAVPVVLPPNASIGVAMGNGDAVTQAEPAQTGRSANSALIRLSQQGGISALYFSTATNQFNFAPSFASVR